MAKHDPKQFSKEQIQKAMACKDAAELIKVAKEEGIELTAEEAESYMSEMSSMELTDDQLKVAAGGCGWDLCVDSPHCPCRDQKF